MSLDEVEVEVERVRSPQLRSFNDIRWSHACPYEHADKSTSHVFRGKKIRCR